MLSTEYEQLLQKLIEEKRQRLESLRKEGHDRQAQELLSEIRYIELEMQHYSEGLALFRTKGVPKVGRWGKPEQEEHPHPPSS